MISGQSVALSLAALCPGEDGLVIAVLFCELLRVEKSFTVQFSEPPLQILGGFTQIARFCSSQLLCLGVSYCRCLCWVVFCLQKKVMVIPAASDSVVL